jgi:hypothetical protein
MVGKPEFSQYPAILKGTLTRNLVGHSAVSDSAGFWVEVTVDSNLTSLASLLKIWSVGANADMLALKHLPVDGPIDFKVGKYSDGGG